MIGKEALAILKLQEKENRRVEITKKANRQKRDAKKIEKASKKVGQKRKKVQERTMNDAEIKETISEKKIQRWLQRSISKELATDSVFVSNIQCSMM